MQCQQTQKLETTLLLVNQDLQVRQGNSSGPRAAHLWEGGRCSNNAAESQNSWKRNGSSGKCHVSSHGQIERHLGKRGEIHSGAMAGLLLSRPPLGSLPLFLPPLPLGESIPRGAQPAAAQNPNSTLPFRSPSLYSPSHSSQPLLHRCQGNSISFILSVATPPLSALPQLLPQLLMSSPILT